MSLEFRMLGPLDARKDSAEVDLGSFKQRAVIAALLVEANSVVSLDRLIDDLWGGDAPARATGTLQAYISNLRRALEPERPPRKPSQVIVTQPPGYILRVDPNAVDAMRFEALVTEGRRLLAEERPDAATNTLGDALALWRGPVLADLATERFVHPVSARLEELRIAALEDRVQAELLLGNHSVVVPQVESLVNDHPYRERLWVLLMLALYRSGRQVDALNAFQKARDILSDELGIDPSPELQKLEVQILQHDPLLEWRPVVVTPPATPRSTVTVDEVPRPHREGLDLVGRERPLDQLRAALSDAGGRRGRIVLLSGEPGIGKTRLAEELTENARGQGFLVAWGRCVEGEASPTFWPWTQSFRQLIAAPGTEPALSAVREELVELLPELAPPSGSADFTLKEPAMARARLHDAAARFLIAVAEVQPLVIVIDDLQWADTPTLSLLTFLAVQVQETPVLLLGTHRSVDVRAEAPLAQTLGDLVRERAVVPISLDGLSEVEVARFLQQATGQRPRSEVVTTVHERTAGNAFFLTELVRLQDSETGGHRWTSLADAIPSSVRDVVRRRLARLPEKSVLFLKTAAVIGREFDLPLLEAVTQLSGDAALDAIEAALITGLIQESEHREEGYRFSHDIVRQTLSSEVSVARRARLHAAVADALEELRADQGPEETLQIAKHMWQGARHLPPARVAGALVRAAIWMMGQLDYEQARVHLQRAADLLDALPTGEEHDELDFAVHLRLGLIGMVREGFANPDVGREFDRARRALGRTEVLQSEGLATLWGSWAFHSGRCDFETALTVSDELLERGQSAADPGALMVGHQSAGITYLHMGRLADSEFHLSESIGIADSAADEGLVRLLQSDPRVVSRASLSLTQALQGRSEDAERLHREAWELGLALDHAFTTVLVISHGARLAVLHRGVERALDLGRKMFEVATLNGYPQFVAGAGFVEGWALAASGRGAEGATKAREAMRNFSSLRGRISLQFFLGLMAEAELFAGYIDRAHNSVERGLAISATSGERFYEAELLRLQGEIIIRRDPARVEDATPYFIRAVNVARSQGSLLLEQRAATALRSATGEV